MAVKVSIGQMRSEVVFKTNAPTALGQGQQDAYSSFLTTRGRLRAKRDNMAEAFGLVAGQSSFELICRFDPTLDAQLLINGKVVVDSEEYTIKSWEVVNQIKHWYKFQLNIQVVS